MLGLWEVEGWKGGEVEGWKGGELGSFCKLLGGLMEETPTAQADSLCYKGFMEEIPTAQETDSLCYKGFSVYRSQGFALKIGFQVGKLNSSANKSGSFNFQIV